jgi:cytochrome c553
MRALKPALLLSLGALLVVGVLLGSYLKPESTPAQRGEASARRAGCFACHGAEGGGGVKDPGSLSGDVPGWDERTLAMYVKNEREIRDWIVHGKLHRSDGGKEGARPGAVPMPAYGGSLSDREIDDMAAYVKAVSGWDPEVPDAAYEGRVRAKDLGCLGCHGHSGMGGVPNPGSLKGVIPSWTGEDYAELVRNEEELREWVLDGMPARLGKNPVARRFLERAKIKMPAYRGRLSEDDMGKLSAYIRRLRS